MIHFNAIAFADTFELAASLRERMGLFRDRPGRRVLSIHGAPKGLDEGSGGMVFFAPYGKWPELKNLLGWLKRMGDARVGGAGVEFGRIFLEMLDPGATLPWAGPDRESGYARLHLPIRTNPAAVMLIGTESLHLLPGQVTVINTRAPSSAINLGEWPRVHLVVDFRKEEAAP